MPGGQPSITQPIAGPCDSPNVVTVKRVPNVLPDMEMFLSTNKVLILPVHQIHKQTYTYTKNIAQEQVDVQ